ncbi:MAG TPA: fumarylacetoacetate hydrolase family protein [Microvirga sp.]|jgi:2-oxo-hept-3-ene-1,7-dioate hydratase|nr:fumarylacetoacetate hydrolase family protein [Microvirga sp.]
MLDAASHHKVVAMLAKAQADRTAMPLPSGLFTPFSLEDGYAVQHAWAGLRIEAGIRHVGYKVGLTSRAMQSALGVSEPHYGHLFDDGLRQSGAAIAMNAFLRPKLEVELAFIMGTDLEGPELMVTDVLRATEFVQPALEIVDYRTAAPRPAPDMVADNMAGAGAILGGRPVRPFDFDLRWIGATLSRNGVIEESGVSAAVMGHPAAGVVALARALAAHGRAIKRGDIILSGSFTRQIEFAAGDVIHADFGPLGSVASAFIAGAT